MKDTGKDTGSMLKQLDAGLEGRVLGHRIHVFAQVDSTNQVAFRMVEGGAREGEVVVADTQTKGRGRLGRSWESPPGSNIYMSVILRPKIPSNRFPLITLMTAVACTEAVDRVTGIMPTIKWPNDLLIDGKKVAGIRTEMGAGTKQAPFVIVGIGINVNISLSRLPESLASLATSLLEELGHEAPRRALIRECLGQMEVWYTRLTDGKGDELRRRWEDLSQVKGRKVEVSAVGEVIRGEAVGIAEDGALLVQEVGNTLRRVVAGDVTLSEW